MRAPVFRSDGGGEPCRAGQPLIPRRSGIIEVLATWRMRTVPESRSSAGSDQRRVDVESGAAWGTPFRRFNCQLFLSHTLETNASRREHQAVAYRRRHAPAVITSSQRSKYCLRTSPAGRDHGEAAQPHFRRINIYHMPHSSAMPRSFEPGSLPQRHPPAIVSQPMTQFRAA